MEYWTDTNNLGASKWLTIEEDFNDFEPRRRCLLESIFLHRLMENETDTVGIEIKISSFDIVNEVVWTACQVSFSGTGWAEMPSNIHHSQRRYYVVLRPFEGVR